MDRKMSLGEAEQLLKKARHIIDELNRAAYGMTMDEAFKCPGCNGCGRCRKGGLHGESKRIPLSGDRGEAQDHA